MQFEDRMMMLTQLKLHCPNTYHTLGTRCWYCTGVLARCVASVGTSSVQQLWHGAASDLSSAAVSVNTEAAEDRVWRTGPPVTLASKATKFSV